jgi:hypothetical protein
MHACACMRRILHLGRTTVNSSRNLFLSQQLKSTFSPRFYSSKPLYQRTSIDTGACSRASAVNRRSMSTQLSQNSKVLVFGAGNFGSCLASHLGDSGHDVYIWARDESIVKHFNIHHRNPMYLRDHQFPSNITAIGPDLPSKEFMAGMEVLLFAIPTQFLRYLRYRSVNQSFKISLR